MQATLSIPKADQLNELQAVTTKLLQEHSRRTAENKLTRRGADPSAFSGLAEMVKAAGGVAPNTKAEYRRRGRREYAQAQHAAEVLDEYTFWDFVELRASTKRSWNTAKVSILFHLAEEMTGDKRAIDEWRRLGVDSATAPERLERLHAAITRLQKMAAVLKAAPVDEAPEKFRFEGKGKRPRSKTKAKSLAGLPPDWREQLAENLVYERRRVWLLQCLTGCRAQELKNGVEAVLQPDGSIIAQVLGAKLGLHAGQPKRVVHVSAESPVAQKLRPYLVLGMPLGVDWLQGTTNAYRQAIRRAAQEAFPGRGENTPSPYSARHQFASDVRAGKHTRETLAKAMGHRAERSQTYYGNFRSGGGGVSLKRAEATHGIKARAGSVLVAKPAPAATEAPRSGGARQRKLRR